jgi:hypothetical protein
MTISTNHLPVDHHLADYPLLASLGLDVEDIVAIADQGFISQDHRGERTYNKLRFRRDGHQRVCYIGNADRAIAVEAELNVLQRDLQLRRRMAELAPSVTSALRTARVKLQALAESQGYYFHGHALRKRRNNTNEQFQR